MSCVFKTCCDQGIDSEKTLFSLPSNCPGCFLLMWAPLIFRVDLPVDSTREFDADSEAHCACRFMQGQISSSLIYHKGVMVMVKAPYTIPAFIKEAPSGFLPRHGPASWAACCYQSLLSVCRVNIVIASNTYQHWYMIKPDTAFIFSRDLLSGDCLVV